MDYLQYPEVYLDDLFPKVQEMHQVTCYWNLFPETVGVCWRDRPVGQVVSIVPAQWWPSVEEPCGMVGEVWKSQGWDISVLLGKCQDVPVPGCASGSS